MKHPLLARTPSHLTVAWAQHVVNQYAPDTPVVSVTQRAIDSGTTTRVRLLIDYAVPTQLPRQWFVKLSPQNWRAKLITYLPQLLQNEVRFYQEVASAIPVSYPQKLVAKTQFGFGSTLVLSDVTEFGAIPGNPDDTLTAAHAYRVIEQLAQLHAQFWGNAHKNPGFRWLNNPVRQLEDALGSALATPLMKRGLAKATHLVPSKLHLPALHYACRRKQAMHYLSQGPQTLIHHDCHPGNLFWHNHQPGFLDWQLVRVGEGISDVAYFLATALEPELRRRHEEKLVTHYLHSLALKGIQGLTFRVYMQRYRAHLVYPFEAMLYTLAIGGLMPLDSNLLLIRRTAKAVDDNHAFSALPI